MSRFADQFSVGQAVAVVIRTSREHSVHDGVISSIGRRWITVKGLGRNVYRFDAEDCDGDQDWGYPPKLWPDRQTYEAAALLDSAWSDFERQIRHIRGRPTHLTVEEIHAMRDKIAGPAE